ncbi:hypothetical protein TorRG33x02_173780 [Trema orientale]|uniref:Uncharacterized protein n=1 Tax=Trema orientale TaxID=63057 RepID=A0A2P5EMX6_TREOI|nr:hypothetical protein TorRG33x02_173780 [Trema orientale]
MGVWKGISFLTLIDKLYEMIRVDKNRFNLELKVVYKCGGGDGIPIPPTKITTDSAEKIDDQEVDPTPPALAACPQEICPPVRDNSDNYYDWGFGAENMRPEELNECFGDSEKDDLGRANNEKEPATNRKRLLISIPEQGESTKVPKTRGTTPGTSSS